MRLPLAAVRVFAASALPLSLWAAVPAVQWCPVSWDQARLECALLGPEAARLAIAAHLLSCPTLVAEAHRSAECAAKCARAGAPGPTTRSCGDPCEAKPAHAADASAAVPVHARSSRTSDHRGHAYCLGGPNGGAGVRPLGPRVQSLALLHAIAPQAQLAVPPPRERVWFLPQLAARPPTRAWAIQPPVRAPPSA